MAHSHFPSINRVANARSTLARTARENELQPGRVEEQTQRNTLRDFDIGARQAGVDSAARVRELNVQAEGGDTSAFGKIIREDPQRAKQQLDAVAKQRKMAADAFEIGALKIGRFANQVANILSDKSVNPEQAQGLYTQARDVFMRKNPDATDDDVPVKISRRFIKDAIGFASDITSLRKQLGIGQGQTIITGGTGTPGQTQQRRVNIAGPEGTVAPPALAAPKGKGKGGAGGEGFQLKPADSNAIRAAANAIYGQIYGPEGELLIVDSAAQVKALRLAARAERIFQRARERGTPMAHSTAVEQAAEELGITKEDFSGGTTVRDQRSPTGRSVDRTGTGKRGSRGSRQNQLDAFKDFTDRLD